ncbi:response regulator [Pontiellaceae bacterium B1224]|nr:response regulator [Pontiellaceae bacterium B1224]
MSELAHRMLFVEPNKELWPIFTAVLKPLENNWKLAFAASALDALSMGESYDFMITANSLPDGNGLGLCDLFKEEAPETIRYLLIEPEEARMFRSLVSSAQQVLIKPLDLKTFKAQLQRSTALRSIVQNQDIRKLLGSGDSLPPLPRIFEELSRKLSDPNAPLSEISELIAKDVTLSSKVLRLANSAFFNLRMPANTIAQATSLLGSNTISSLVFSQSVSKSFMSEFVSEHFIEELNQHSIEVASLASDILETWGASSAVVEKVLLCGIAHDLGKIVLAKYAPEKWQEAQAEIQTSERSDAEIEREIIGLGHPELAAYLLAIWGFSTDQIMAIIFHHEPSRANETEFGLLCALHVAEHCCEKELPNQHFDWNYLEGFRITETEVDGFKAMLEEKRSQH